MDVSVLNLRQKSSRKLESKSYSKRPKTDLPFNQTETITTLDNKSLSKKGSVPGRPKSARPESRRGTINVSNVDAIKKTTSQMKIKRSEKIGRPQTPVLEGLNGQGKVKTIIRKLELKRTNEKHLQKGSDVSRDSEHKSDAMTLTPGVKMNRSKNVHNTVQSNWTSPIKPETPLSRVLSEGKVSSPGTHNIHGISPPFTSRIPVPAYKNVQLSEEGTSGDITARTSLRIIYPVDEEAYYANLDPVEYFDDKTVWDLPIPPPPKTQRVVAIDTKPQTLKHVSEKLPFSKHSPKLRPWSESINDQEKMLMNRKKSVNTKNSVYAMFFEDKFEDPSLVRMPEEGDVITHAFPVKHKPLRPLTEKQRDVVNSPGLVSIREDTHKLQKREPKTGYYGNAYHGNNNNKHNNKWAVQNQYKPPPGGEKNHVHFRTGSKFIHNTLTVRGYNSELDNRPFSEFNLPDNEVLELKSNKNHQGPLDNLIMKYNNKNQQVSSNNQKFQRARVNENIPVPRSEIAHPNGLLVSSETIKYRNVHSINATKPSPQPRRLKPMVLGRNTND